MRRVRTRGRLAPPTPTGSPCVGSGGVGRGGYGAAFPVGRVPILPVSRGGLRGRPSESSGSWPILIHHSFKDLHIHHRLLVDPDTAAIGNRLDEVAGLVELPGFFQVYVRPLWILGDE